jgi:D-cysteine desulfhydrase
MDSPVGSHLEDRFPHLRGQRLSLGDWPTPVRAVDVGGPEPLWVKDEGRAARPYGGNKVRKLEWLLPHVRRRHRAMITAGAVGSNHVLACAVYGAKIGLRVHAILVPQPETPEARANAGAISQLAHRVWPAQSETRAVGLLGRALAAAWAEEGRRPAIVWVGGTSPRGILGWVNGGLEIAAQVERGELPRPARVVVAAGTGGVAVGLLLGFAVAGLDTTIQAVRVADRIWVNRAMLDLHARRTARLLSADGPPVTFDRRRLVVDESWIGRGYGVATSAGTEATKLVTDAQIALDPTYTAKACAAAIDAVRRPDPLGPILYIHTKNAVPLEEAAGTPLPEPSDALARLLRPPPAR